MTAEPVFRVCQACFDALREGVMSHPCHTDWCDCCHPVLQDSGVDPEEES